MNQNRGYIYECTKWIQDSKENIYLESNKKTYNKGPLEKYYALINKEIIFKLIIRIIDII